MLRPINHKEELAASRLLELCGANPQWYRSLWGVGIELSLHELIEACDAMRAGTLSDTSVKRLAKSIQRMAGEDPALTSKEKSTLNERLRDVPRPGGEAYYAICHLCHGIQENYLKRWADVVHSGARHSAERFAKSLAAHLLDKGFSSAYLHQSIKAKLYEDAQEITLAELCEELQSLERTTPVRKFGVLVAFEHPPRLAGGFAHGWLNAAEISRWLKEEGHTTSGIRPAGGFLWTVEARDPHGGADAARALLDRYSARASIGTGRALSPLPTLWVEGLGEPLPIKNASRGVRVEELYREGLVFAHAQDAVTESVDAAIELLAHLEDSSPTAAVAGGWAAIEGLLGEPNNRSIAADHLASLVACSVPRAELTALSYKVEKHCPDVVPRLASSATNRERSVLLAQAIAKGVRFQLPHGSDHAAFERMATMLADPGRTLTSIRELIGDAFHRLYRQRNLVLHGGKTSSVALTGSLRTVAKLAGAGMDRIAHGLYVSRLKPMELVARAGLAIKMADAASPDRCADLLEA